MSPNVRMHPSERRASFRRRFTADSRSKLLEAEFHNVTRPSTRARENIEGGEQPNRRSIAVDQESDLSRSHRPVHGP